MKDQTIAHAKKSKLKDILDTIDRMTTEGAEQGLGQLTAEDENLSGRTIRIAGKDLINFGSCSYLGLETDIRLKNASIEAIKKYGTTYSSSRSYVSAPPYKEMETLCEQVFGRPTLASTTSLLGHLATFPVLIENGDAVIFDQHVHNTVQTALHQLRVQGITVEMCRHNDMERLEARIVELKKDHRHIWYLADGVYSMHGVVAPLNAIEKILERHEELHVYFDDAHGVGWFGHHGRGVVLEKFHSHPRVLVALSFAKSFGCGGAAIAFPNQEMLRRVKNCGGPMIFCGPLQPAVIGSVIKSLQIHLSDEVSLLQEKLSERISLFNELMKSKDLPLTNIEQVPIRFVELGTIDVTYKIAQEMIQKGFYINSAIYPAVPQNHTGLRLTLTNHQRPEDIHNFVEALASLLVSF